MNDNFPIYFATSGIRGKSNIEITPAFMLRLANAISQWIKKSNDPKTVIVNLGYDNRRDSYALAHTFAAGMSSFGINIRMSKTEVSTPMLIHATVNSDAKYGVMITGSHLPAQDNGFILFNYQGDYYTGKMEEKDPNPVKWDELGKISFFTDEIESYKSFLFMLSKNLGLEKLPMKVLLDPVHGVMKPYLESILEPLVDELLKVNWDYDDRFPGRPSEPNEENLQRTRETFLSLECDLGIGTDMDGDRVLFISKSGRIISGDYIGALFASRLWKSNPSAVVVAPINTSAIIEITAEKYGGKVEYCKVGPPNIIDKLRETKAKLGFEETGKYIFTDIAIWPDSAISTLKLLDLLRSEGKSLDTIMAEFPLLFSLKTKLPMSRKHAPTVLQRLKERINKDFNDIQSINEMDGLKISFNDKSWLLLRPSGTEDYIRIFSEAHTEDTNAQLNQKGQMIIESILSTLE